MFCPKCGAKNEDINYYCSKCGADLSRVIAPKEFRIDPRAKETQAYFKQNILIGGRYKMLKELGRGGRGVVYKAVDQQLQMIIAMKFLPQEMANNEKAVEDLKREAKSSMMLTHQNIVRLFNFELIDRYTFITMEYIDGQSLEDSLQKRKRFMLKESIEYTHQVCKGLGYAHKRGVVHRDIKPANLMKTIEGIIKITDFGIAAQIHDCLKKMTKQSVVGTPLYMSPEQLLGEPLDHRSDIYSLGAALYEFLSGRTPFYQGAIEFQIIHEKPRPLLDIPPHINHAILKALEKDKEKRWKSADAFSKALEEKVTPEIKITTKGKKAQITDRILGKFKSIPEEKKPALPKPKSIPKPSPRPFKAKVSLWKKVKPYMLRHSLLLVWPFIFGYLLSLLTIKLSAGWEELILFLSFFLQALLIGLISRISLISLTSLIILASSPYWSGRDISNSYLYSQGFLIIAVVSLLFGFYSFLVTFLNNRVERKRYNFWRYRDIIWIGWAFVFGYIFIPTLETSGLMVDPIILFLFNAFILGFFCRNLLLGLFLLPIIILGWALSQTELSFLFANYRNLAAELRIFSLLTSIKSLYIKIGEFAALTFIMALGAKLSFTISKQIRDVWKKVIVIVFLILFFASIGGVAFWLKIFRDTSIGDMVWLPEGEFLMGTNPNNSGELATIFDVNHEILLNEQPQRIVFLEGFYIDRFEVTNIQYKKFIETTNHTPPENWVNGNYPLGKGNHPVTGVSWKDANAFAEWAGKRLPTEMEWEKAARGKSGGEFPWEGNSTSWSILGLIKLHRCNIDSTEKTGTVPVGSYFLSRSPGGVYDMAGNAMEWVDSPYKPYIGSKNRDPEYKKGLYVLRGGSWFKDRFYARSAARIAKRPDENNLETGFRCVLSNDKE